MTAHYKPGSNHPLGFVILAALVLTTFTDANFGTSASAAESAPQFVWTRKAGGTAEDYGRALALDSSGNCYVLGRFSGTAQFGSTNLTSGPNSFDCFVAKYTLAGNLVWVRQIGGGNDDFRLGIAVDSASNCYVTGSFLNTASFGSTNLTSTGLTDIFLAKYDSNGNLQWARKAGGSGFEVSQGIAVAFDGSCYITGGFNGTASFGSTNLTTTGFYDIFIARYNSSGTLLWVRQAGSNTDDGGLGIGVDGVGNCYVTGGFGNTANFGGTTNLTSSGGISHDNFLAKYTAAGDFLWARQYGSTNHDSSYAITVDTNGNSYVAGTFYGTSRFFGTPTTLTSANNSLDAFIAKYGSDGNLFWATRAGGTLDDVAKGISIDRNGNSFITGTFYGTATLGGHVLNSAGGTDIFVAKYDTSGNPLWGLKAGGTSDDEGFSILSNTINALYCTGRFRSTCSFGGNDLNSSGAADFFLTKLVNNPRLAISKSDDNVTLAWDSPDFVLQWSSDLSQTDWPDIATGAATTYSEAAILSPKFYRLKAAGN